jgi:hypothetical protein
VGRQYLQRAVWPVLVVVAAVDAEDVFEVAPAEDEDPVEAVSADGAHPALGEGVGVRRLTAVGITLMPSPRKTSSEAWLNLVSRSWMRSRNGCSSPSCMTRLRACWVAQRPSGFELQAMYSIRLVASEMKNST